MYSGYAAYSSAEPVLGNVRRTEKSMHGMLYHFHLLKSAAVLLLQGSGALSG